MNKILTLDDLYNFYSKQATTCSFNSQDAGYQISVQVPAQFEVNKEQGDDSLLFCLVKVFHTGENRNHSSVTEEAANKAMKTMAYKPILANFCEINGVKDFTSHDMKRSEDGSVTEYLERQIGCFTADAPYMELEEETGHNFVYAYCAIPREYTDACEIIERKSGTKVSVELAVNEMQYSAEKKVLELTDVVVLGATCLGVNPETGRPVEEGMKNARLDIADFSVKNNSVINCVEQLSEVTEKLTTLLSHFDIKENGKEDLELNENIQMEEDIVVEDDVVVEVAEEATETVESDAISCDAEETPESEVAETTEEVDDATDDVVEDEEVEGIEVQEEVLPVYSAKFELANGTDVKTFELSLDDIQFALSNLVNAAYAEADNSFYMVHAYAEYVVMEDWFTGKAYKQSYERNEDAFNLVGDRVDVYATWCTADEVKALDDMRASFKDTVSKLANYESEPEKMAILNSDDYALVREAEEFKKLAEVETHFELSVDEVRAKADQILLASAKARTFALETENTTVSRKPSIPFGETPKVGGRYGNLFSKK